MSSALVLFNGLNPLFNLPTRQMPIMSPKSILSIPVNLILESMSSMNMLCITIREKRHTGSITLALDNLQESIEDTRRVLLATTIALHEGYGAAIDDGNDHVIQPLHTCNDKLCDELLPKLRRIAFRENIANPLSSQFGARMESPHFGEITTRFKEIEDDIHDILRAVRRRVDNTGPSPRINNAPLRGILKRENRVGSEDTLVNSKVLQGYIRHAKDSWLETLVGGKVGYVNRFDETNIRQERPEGGFIKPLSSAQAKTLLEDALAKQSQVEDDVRQAKISEIIRQERIERQRRRDEADEREFKEGIKKFGNNSAIHAFQNQLAERERFNKRALENERREGDLRLARAMEEEELRREDEDFRRLREAQGYGPIGQRGQIGWYQRMPH